MLLGRPLATAFTSGGQLLWEPRNVQRHKPLRFTGKIYRIPLSCTTRASRKVRAARRASRDLEKNYRESVKTEVPVRFYLREPIGGPALVAPTTNSRSLRAVYLCYDIKGIQRFIFSVPKLKCVVGASGLIVNFDTTTATAAERYGITRIYSGGGRGAFECPGRTEAESAAQFLINEAHQVGLDIRIGIDESLSHAAHHADQLHPYCPVDLNGVPCAVSGLWPVANGSVHPLIQKRYAEAKEDRLGKNLLEELHTNDLLPKGLHEVDELRFFRTISAEKDDDPQLIDEADASDHALGNRNRWAVVAMDGNDMGRQFLAFTRRQREQHFSESQMRLWLCKMSQRLSQCTRAAFVKALASAISVWWDQLKEGDSVSPNDCIYTNHQGKRVLVLPFRPLILGGDDVTLLCHPGLAMHFVRTMCREFATESQRAAEQSPIKPLWPATGDCLSISAGILFTKVSVPLHMAIPYAESLLASAKGRFRNTANDGQPTPAAVDWDAVTDTLIDTPAARRNRELRFVDPDLDIEIRLTRRPYLIEEGSNAPPLASLFDQMAMLKSEGVPRTVRASLLPALRKPWSERIAFVASLAKRYPRLKELLWEGGDKLGDGWHAEDDKKIRTTGLPDALSLLEEEDRLNRPSDD